MANRKARVVYQMRGRDLPKAKLYYTWVWPIVNWIQVQLTLVEMEITEVLPPPTYQIECSYSGLTREQEHALGDMVVGYAEGFYLQLTGIFNKGLGEYVLLGFTYEQAATLLKVAQAFVEGLGGTWIDSEVYSTDSEGVRNG